MLTTMESCLRHTRRTLHKWALDPRIQTGARMAAYSGGGLFLSSAPLCGGFQPLAMGLVCALEGWRAVLTAAGAAAGYRLFWGSQGIQGSFWAAAGCVLALICGRKKTVQAWPMLLPALTAVTAAATGLAFLLFRQESNLQLFFLRLCLAPAAVLFFRRAFAVRDSLTDWICGGLAVLSLVRAGPAGYLLAGIFSVWTSFPAAVVAGLGLELAGVTALPMSVVVCIAWFGRMIPFRDRWMRFWLPGVACLGVMALCGVWDLRPLPGLVLGGLAGYLLPPRPDGASRRGETGLIQVRLELAAGLMARTQQTLLEITEQPIDEGALLNRAVNRACGNCVSRENCVERARLSREYLHDPLQFACRRPWEIQGELLRARERLRDLNADRSRRQEYRRAMIRQYQVLSVYLQHLSDQLLQRGERIRAGYRLEVSARSRGKERSNGDSCLAFPGVGCRYYVLLCDGMGTGLGAAREGQTAGELLRQMLSAGFPPEHAFRWVNSLLVLRGQAGAVTMDLAEVRLDSGRVSLYKWGAAPSYLLGRSGTEKIGTAAPPPGIDLEKARESVDRLSLRRGEMLILVSDGAEIGEPLGRREIGPLPPGELAEWLLKECRSSGEDDATVAVLRLVPRQMST